MKAHRILTTVIMCTTLISCMYADLRSDEPRSRTKLMNADHHHEGHLSTDMQSMFRSAMALMTLETDGGITEEERLSRIMRELNNLDDTARILRDGKEITQYSLASPYMGSFIHDVRMAKEFAALSPPDFVPAYGLIRSCQYCHENK